MTEYKDTLNLPKTEFPMKASLATREPDWINAWEESKLYQKIRQKRAGAKQFILHDGPPYANGHLHCGHAFNKILKDIIIKSKTLAGYDAPYVPGWDCHGLPIELNVEKKYGKAGVKLSAREFRQKCREYAASQIDIQRQEFKRFGVLGDWQNPYITMDFAYEANIIRALAKIVRNNHLQQGFKPVHWCLDCASALAEAEVEYENKTSPAIDVAFNVVDTAAFAQRLSVTLTTAPIAVPIWTTTPWTLPANQAVALNAELTYVLLLDKQANRYLLVAEGLKEQVLARYGVSDETIVATVQGALLEGLRLQHPLFDNKHVPIVLADHVSLEAGTGCVHTAPAHGPDDYKVGLQYQLPLENPVMANGCYADSVTGFAGLYVAKADECIIDALRANDCLLHAEKINHSYPHCWRHKTPIIFRATPQWFISMDKAQLRTKSMQAIKETQFIPDWGQARIAGMVEQRPDWCISRQRAWGVPIPLFVHKQTGELHPETDALMEEIANRVEKEGIDAWFELAPETLLGESAAEYDKVMDTLDVWFDSGVSHFSVLEQRPGLAWPADLYLEGSDQHRGWFNSSLMTACAINGTAPYKTILTHGFTVDAEGKKMSKSKGNYIAPEKLIQQSGADILRLWVASTDYRGDVHLSDEIIKRTSDAYRRIRNTCRFLLANLFDFDYAKHAVAVEQMVELDKWAIKQAQLLQEAVVSAYDSYDFHTIYQKIHNFCAVEMGSFYLDIIKDRQYTAATESVARRSCQTAMYHIIEALVRLMAPILSFTANEVWRYLPGSRDEAVFLSEWYQGFPAVGAVDLAKWQRLRLVRDEVNKAIEQKRKTKELGAALEAEVSLYANALYYQDLMQLQDELRFLLITSSATVQSLSEATSGEGVATDLPELKLNITASEAPKCGRCWHRIADVGRIAEHPALCGRCVGNVSGAPEERQYA